MIKLLQSSLTASILGMVLYLGTTAAFWKITPPPSLVHGEHASDEFNLNFKNQEIEMLVQELRREKETLEGRAVQLKELELRLQADRAELTNATQQIQRMQRDFEQTVTRVREDEVANLKKLAKTYASMTPEGAAKILGEMDDAAIVKILMFLKESESAPILESLAQGGNPATKRVAKISERLRLSTADKTSTAKKNP